MELHSGDLVIALLSVAFGLWAGVVGWLGHGIRQDLRTLGANLEDQAKRLNAYIVQTESRLSVIEDRINSNRS